MGDALEMLTYDQKHCPTKQSSGRLAAAVDFCVRLHELQYSLCRDIAFML